jgi:ubiquinone/menaquinone biosynthesis C-methylase UbiE
MHAKARVLDLGSGWGTVSLHLASMCEQVVAFDQMSLHLRWLRTVSEARDVHNIVLVQGGDTNHLPFPSGAFDAVIMNGVLEHVATNTMGDPQAVQRRILREAARILKPGGVLYIGIENRLNYKYFLGVREGHIKMKYGALLPRPITRWYLWLTRRQPFREYTYSLLGYRKLLRSAGLSHQRFFAPWPTYSSAGQFFPVRETERTPHWHVHAKHPAARSPGWYFTRAYSMVAAPHPPATSLMERVLQEIALRTERPLPWTLEDHLFRASSGGKATLRIAAGQGQPAWFIQVGLTPLSGQRILAEHRAMAALHTLPLEPELARRIPASLMTGEVAGYVYGIRELAKGQNGGELIHRQGSREALCRQAEEFLCGLHQSAGRLVRLDEALFERLVTKPIAGVRPWFTALEWADYAPWFTRQTVWLRERLLGASLRIVPYHGDFVPENCVWDAGRQALSQVLDWELYDGAGLPMVDWVTFLGCAYRPLVKTQMRSRGDDPAQVKFHGYPHIFLGEPLRNALNRYLDRLEMDRAWLMPLLFMWWIRQLQDWAAFHLYNPEWRRRRLFPVMDRLKSLCAETME